MQLYNNWLCIVLLQELFKRLPRQRKLSSYEKDVEQLLSVKANKKMIADKVANKSGKVVLLKDTTNVSSAMKAGKSRNDLYGSSLKNMVILLYCMQFQVAYIQKLLESSPHS